MREEILSAGEAMVQCGEYFSDSFDKAPVTQAHDSRQGGYVTSLFLAVSNRWVRTREGFVCFQGTNPTGTCELDWRWKRRDLLTFVKAVKITCNSETLNLYKVEVTYFWKPVRNLWQQFLAHTKKKPWKIFTFPFGVSWDSGICSEAVDLGKYGDFNTACLRASYLKMEELPPGLRQMLC